MSVARYRAVDLTFFAVMTALSEWVTVLAATRWFPGEAYTVSAGAALTAVVMVRWGPWCVLPAAVSGLVYCLAAHAAPGQFAVYILGNLFCLPAFFYVRHTGDEALRKDPLKAMLLGFLVLLGMQAGRGVVSVVLGASLAAAAGFILTDVISYIFTLVILWIVRHLDGILEEQHHYLHRVHKEREEEEKGGF